jgi:hypothetical protein
MDLTLQPWPAPEKPEAPSRLRECLEAARYPWRALKRRWTLLMT